ncbi:sensor histidine kinase [Nitrososphaera viennensis]|uniref:Sensor histidine kinase n=2 Tax=Nitrososphaera viennensis TaxID=1034015 RepID=A0A977NMY2_9ARCH|nr:sensor histidine kinase [Nitrososphaera viennensis]AIC14950.1 putative membrane associated signal transduction histidine kinase, with phosphoacceptor and ATP binding domain [Nitrososphaera viennensis EN76]UVS69887.1 sensor histidine kinase [Nitrososphaera viennensis]
MSVNDIRSNADIQTYDLANLVSSEISHVQSVLQMLSKSPLIQDGDFEKAKETLNQAEDSTSEIVDFYMWLDRDGKLVWVSKMNQTAYEQYKDFDLSYRLYFINPKDTREVYYSSVIDSNDRIPRLYISCPILSKEGEGEAAASAAPSVTSSSSASGSGGNNVTQGQQQFEGIIVAGIRTDIFGRFLKGQISPNLQSQVGLLDNRGIILYSNHTEYMGKNVFGFQFQSFLDEFDAETVRAMNDGLKAALGGNSGSRDIRISDSNDDDGGGAGDAATFVYKPIILDGKQFGALYVIASYAQVSDAAALVNLQQNLSTGTIGVIGASALGIIFAILLWNRRLEETVSARTAELKAANEQLKAHDKMQSEFVNIAAHELRTPIQPIIGTIDMLKHRLDSSSSNKSKGRVVQVTEEQLALMDRNARRLQKLSAEILDATRIESGTLRLDQEVIDINEKVESVIADAKSLIPQGQSIDIQFKPAVDERGNPVQLLVMADKLRMFEVISNLVRNAIKYSAEDGGTITIATDKRDGQVVVSVRDQGAGISAEMFTRLFTKFSTDKKKGGTGLGLFIAKNIVEAHGGRIWAENNNSRGEKGARGATFAFTLPMDK